MTTRTTTTTYTRTRTETYISSKIAYAMQVILAELGLGAASQGHDWDDAERAMGVWLGEQSLNAATLEVYNRFSGQLVARFDFGISYVSGEASMRHDADLARVAARKVSGHAASSLEFRLLMFSEPWRADVDGWSSTTARNTSGLRSRSVGEMARGPGIVSELSYRI